MWRRREERFAKGLVDVHRAGVRPGSLLADLRCQAVQIARVKPRMGSAQGVCGPGIGSEHASLVNCLIGAAILQLRRAVSRDGNQRNTGLAGFDDGRQPVGRRGAGSGQKQYRVPLHLGHSEGEESSTAFVDRDMAAQPGLAQHGQRQGVEREPGEMTASVTPAAIKPAIRACDQ
jgi:hypothetical protein